MYPDSSNATRSPSSGWNPGEEYYYGDEAGDEAGDGAGDGDGDADDWSDVMEEDEDEGEDEDKAIQRRRRQRRNKQRHYVRIRVIFPLFLIFKFWPLLPPAITDFHRAL